MSLLTDGEVDGVLRARGGDVEAIHRTPDAKPKPPRHPPAAAPRPADAAALNRSLVRQATRFPPLCSAQAAPRAPVHSARSCRPAPADLFLLLPPPRHVDAAVHLRHPRAAGDPGRDALHCAGGTSSTGALRSRPPASPGGPRPAAVPPRHVDAAVHLRHPSIPLQQGYVVVLAAEPSERF